jgi:O-methyltransferase
MDVQTARELLEKEGWGVIPPSQYRTDFPQSFLQLWDTIRPYTMTSAERAFALYEAVQYVENARLDGEFVECGVWKGGSCMLMALALDSLKRKRSIHLYDTFTGMPEPGDEDVISHNQVHVSKPMAEHKFDHWAVSRAEVEKSIGSFSSQSLIFHEGDVAQTLKTDLPEKIALLRLDTDWYASTKLELELLYPRLVSGAVCIIDDYGHFDGARKAVDEYFADKPVYLARVDYTGRVIIKT